MKLMGLRSWSEWRRVLSIALIVLFVVAVPFYVAREVHQDNDRILAQIEHNAEEAADRAIRVNVFTISCLAGDDDEPFDQQAFEQCIRDAFARNNIPPPDKLGE